MENNYRAQQCCKAIITRISVIKHQHMDVHETAAAHADIKDMLTLADQLGISWTLQNSLLYVGETHDVRSFYLDDLLRMAYDRAGCPVSA